MTRLIFTAFIAIAISACSGIPVSQDFEQGFDFSGLKTFAWEANQENQWGIASSNELVDRRVRSAIENTLTGRQFSQVDAAQADFLVLYNITVDQRISSSNVSGGVAVGRSSRGRHGSIGISTGSQVRTYDQGTLLIDVIDVASDKLVWRGTSSQALPDLSDPQRLTDHINATVAKILEQFPPGGRPAKTGGY
ncbi:MAG: DUF4136 domain-containing protein [Thiotrichales bacterium]|nr:MAG: DUF4136 domain-containing protein [Thiotrichales bacterium]